MSDLRVLSISTLFPDPVRPAFGKFVAYQMNAITARGDVGLTMINPIGVPPWPLSLREPYRAYSRIPAASRTAGIDTLHPQFRLIPRFGGDSNPSRIARAVLPIARRLHAETPFDLVDAQFFFPDGPAAAIVARALGIPLTITSRGSDIHYWQTRPAALAQIKAAGAQAARLLCVSAALGRDLVALGMPDDRVVVHYTGLDRDRFRPLERGEARRRTALNPLLALPPDGPLFVTPGALIPLKGQRIAIEAVQQLPGATLALAGKGVDEVALRKMVQDLGLSDQVHFLGQVSHDDLPVLLSAADAMVLPSEREGLANVWVEALACGTPVVITDVGGASELVRSPSAGRLAERNPDAFAAAMRDVLTNPLPQATVAANAEQFSWEKNAARMVSIWQAAIAHGA